MYPTLTKKHFSLNHLCPDRRKQILRYNNGLTVLNNPSLATSDEGQGLTKLSQSTIRRALHDLRKEGLLITEQRYRKTGGKSSLLYRIKAE